jgi:hypothetical protein
MEQVGWLKCSPNLQKVLASQGFNYRLHQDDQELGLPGGAVV